MKQLELPIDSNKRHACYVRMSAAEYNRLLAIVAATGESAPELFRNALFSQKDLERPIFTREDAQEIKVALNRIGNNINQISKHLNQGERAGWNISFNSFQRAVVDLRHLFLGKHANR